jgi:hypothetical protein
MSTEINKNIKWSNRDDVKKRRSKLTSSIIKTSLNSIINSFVNAVKNKHT